MSETTQMAVMTTMKCEPNQSSRWPLSRTTCMAPKAEGEQAESDEINTEAFAFFLLHVRRIADEHVGEQERNDADRNIDEENPAPIEIVSDPSAERGTDCWREHHGHAVHREGHAAFSRLETCPRESPARWVASRRRPRPAARETQSACVRLGARPQRNELIVKSATHDM